MFSGFENKTKRLFSNTATYVITVTNNSLSLCTTPLSGVVINILKGGSLSGSLFLSNSKKVIGG